jgi:hypothetical protein
MRLNPGDGLFMTARPHGRNPSPWRKCWGFFIIGGRVLLFDLAIWNVARSAAREGAAFNWGHFQCLLGYI